MSDLSKQGAASDAGHPVDLPDLLPVSTVARKTNLSSMTVRRRVNSGAWPSVRSGRKILIPRAFVEGWLAFKTGTQVVAEDYAAEWMARKASEVAS